MPTCAIESHAIKVHGLTPKFLRDVQAPNWKVVSTAAFNKMCQFFLSTGLCGRKRPKLLAHNLQFDLQTWRINDRMVDLKNSEYLATQLDGLCSVRMASQIDRSNYNLEFLSNKYKIVNPKPHSALGDTITTALILPHVGLFLNNNKLTFVNTFANQNR
jgi:DNA polymerase III epsilon subunit-like protein